MENPVFGDFRKEISRDFQNDTCFLKEKQRASVINTKRESLFFFYKKIFNILIANKETNTVFEQSLFL